VCLFPRHTAYFLRRRPFSYRRRALQLPQHVFLETAAARPAATPAVIFPIRRPEVLRKFLAALLADVRGVG
jgi:hypothetical protein